MRKRTAAGLALVASALLLRWALQEPASRVEVAAQAPVAASSDAGGDGPRELPEPEGEPQPPEVPPPPPEVDLAEVRHVLVLDPQGSPVAEAVVEFLAMGSGFSMAPARPVGPTNARGQAALPEADWPSPGVVRAQHPDFAPGDALATADADGITVRLGPASRIEGTVTESDGTPVSGAVVRLTGLPRFHSLGTMDGTVGVLRRETTAGADGAFRLGGLPALDGVTLRAEAPGYVGLARPFEPDGEGRAHLVLDRMFRVVVRVMSASDEPVSGATVGVVASPASDLGRSRGGRTPDWVEFREEGRGFYSCTALPAGWYTGVIARHGFSLRVEDWMLNHRTGEIRIVLQPVREVVGTLVEAGFGKPVGGASVAFDPLYREKDDWRVPEFPLSGLVDSIGSPLIVESDFEGRFRVSVMARAFGGVLRIRHRGFHPVDFVLDPAERSGPGTIVLQSRVHLDIRGRVVDPQGMPVAGALLRWEEGHLVTGDDGGFEINTVLDGGTVIVQASGYFPLSVPLTRARQGYLPDWTLQPLDVVRGRVEDASGRPLPNVLIEVEMTRKTASHYKGSGGGYGVSDGEGNVALAVLHGEDLVLEPGNRLLYSGKCTVRSGDAEPFRLVLRSRWTRGDGVVRGRLEMEDGSWPGGRVSVRPSDRNRTPLEAVEVRPDGRFEIRDLASGIYDLVLSDTGRARGELRGVAVGATGTVDVVVPVFLTVTGPADAASSLRSRIRVRAVPGGTAGGGRDYAAWRYQTGDSRSLPMRPEEEGVYAAAVEESAAVSVHVADRRGNRAGILTALKPGAEELVDLLLAPAGTVLIPAETSRAVQTVRVRDSADSLVLMVDSHDLPMAEGGGGTLLLLPPGTWTVSATTGSEEEGPQRRRITVVAGETVRL